MANTFENNTNLSMIPFVSIINLTPHEINVYDGDGNHIVDLPKPSEDTIIPRVSQKEELLGYIGDMPITRQVFGEVEGLPEEQLDIAVFYVVSRMVAQACPDRQDLLVPGPLVRNEQGQPCGCHGLSHI